MEFKRFKRKGIIFNNNSQGIGLEVKLGKMLKAFRIERVFIKEDNSFDYFIFDSQRKIEGVKKNEIITFLKKKKLNINFLKESLNYGRQLSNAYRLVIFLF